MQADKPGNGPKTGRGRIAIVGAGIGGHAAAAFLHRAGIPTRVYEQSRVLREVPLSHTDWIYSYDAEQEAAAAERCDPVP